MSEFFFHAFLNPTIFEYVIVFMLGQEGCLK